MIDLRPNFRLGLQEEKHDVSIYTSILVHRVCGHDGGSGRQRSTGHAKNCTWSNGDSYRPEIIYPHNSHSRWSRLVINQISRSEGSQDSHQEQTNNG